MFNDSASTAVKWKGQPTLWSTITLFSIQVHSFQQTHRTIQCVV